jgi:hypothetical protein
MALSPPVCEVERLTSWDFNFALISANDAIM